MLDQPRRGSLLVVAILLAALGLAIGGQRMPDVVPATAEATQVSGGRAMALLERLAAGPRPSGDSAHRQAQELLANELAASGYAVERHRGVLGIELLNLSVWIAGNEPTGTVLLLAHYDSVPRSPGAGDDGVGVVSWVEALRALAAASWRPRNDVLLLLTDGEECGMLGAMHFARTDPRVAKVKTIVNLEAIGNGGPAYLFELGKQNGARVRLFGECVARPAGSSFAEAVYHLLPNDTDLSVFLKRGTPGFNLALTRGTCAYHAPHDTPANIDPRSVQHMADCATALARRLGDVDLGTLLADDVSFIDASGLGLIVYPRSWDLAIAIAAAGLAITILVRARTPGRAAASELVRHVVGVALWSAIVVGGAWICIQAAGWLRPTTGHVAGNTTSAALLFAGGIGFGIVGSLPSANATEACLQRRAAAAALLWGLAGLAASLWLPGTAFACTWPALALGLTLALPQRWRQSWPATLAPFVFALGLGLPIVHLLVQLMAPRPVIALALATVVSTSAARLLSIPLAAVSRHAPLRRLLWWLAALALLGSVVVARGFGWRCGALWP
jgi:hypothetical protein